MKLGRRSTLRDVVQSLAEVLRRSGIRCVLTGGACASLYSAGRYRSEDLDFILQTSVGRERLDAAMKQAGFERKGDQYFHPEARYFVEFPAGPLAIGNDLGIRPVDFRIGKVILSMLSPTDCCRDRLAAFYHWSDRQSLRAAVQVALRHPVSLEVIERWSRAEGAAAGYEEFSSALTRARKSRRTHKSTRPGRS